MTARCTETTHPRSSRARVVEDAELRWVATGDAGLLGQRAGEVVDELLALVRDAGDGRPHGLVADSGGEGTRQE